MRPTIDFLTAYVEKQLENYFPTLAEAIVLDPNLVSQALENTRACIKRVRGSNAEGFDYLNSGNYATFIYKLSWLVAQNNSNKIVATKLFLLNKALNGIDLFYEVKMPEFFLIGHTVGMVFAKAFYSDYCVFHQGCTVGRNQEDRPILERGIVLYPNSSIIGACHVGENTVIAPGVQLINMDTPGNCLVFQGEKGRPIFKEINEYYAERYFYISN